MVDRDEVAELVLARIRTGGAEYGDLRILDSQTQVVRGEDRRIAGIQDSHDSGFGVRVVYHGAWGFAASCVISLEEIPRVADLAEEIAKGSASLAITKKPVVRGGRSAAPKNLSWGTICLPLLLLAAMNIRSTSCRRPGPKAGFSSGFTALSGVIGRGSVVISRLRIGTV